MRLKKKYLTLAAAMVMALGAQEAEARVKLPQVLSSGMIVQRETPVKLWGMADPGEEIVVKVTTARNKTVGPKKGVTTVAGKDGRWQVEFPALKAGGPYTVTINDVKVDNVLSGDVFLCSGQSNMELPVRRVTDMFADEIASYSSETVRQFNVPSEVEFHRPLDDFKGGSWKPCTQDNVMNFSALGYFFAKDLNARTGVPVGIINSSWGGTPVESWISEESLAESFPRAINEKRIYENDAYRDHIKKVEGENYAQWNAALYAGDPGLHGTLKWYAPEFDDSSWALAHITKGTITGGGNSGDGIHNGWTRNSWASDGLNAINGSHWFRKDITLTASQAAKPAVLRLGCIVDADSVYVNGTFVGNTTYQYPPRIYTIPAGVLKEGVNNITIRLISQNGRGRFVPEKPYRLLLGDEIVNLEGEWRYHLGAPMPHGPGMEFYCYKPTVLYNAMINPLVKLPVAGVVWYQGESNVSRRNEYAPLLKTMMADWRRAFDNPEMPFYIIELADYLHESDKNGRRAWAEMRRAQAAAAASTPGAVLIKNADLGEWNDIHPLDKKTLAGRVADAVMDGKNK